MTTSISIALHRLLRTLLLLAFAVSAQSLRAQPRNVIFILSDDHRYDFMSFHENAPEFLSTPSMDRMAAQGMHLRNAFVTTSLCSPSRASIFTGQYAHHHRVVDNTSPVPPDVRFFPSDLQEAGYATAFMGKWHMGESTDDPKPGFDHWISFRGQGVYYNPTLNVDGERSRYEGYTTDLLTDFAIDWLSDQISDDEDQPFFLFLSHKAVHAEFEPAERHAGVYGDVEIPYPASMANTESNYRDKPAWVKAQRYGWHGVDYAYHGQLDFDTFYRRYAETLLGVDESVGRVLDFVDSAGIADETLVMYMGDNGFMLGEHGLIDKRQAYEESIRVPMLAYAPGYIEPGSVTESLIRNIDIAPTIEKLAGLEIPDRMDGRSFLPALTGEPETGSGEFLYEYYWEYAFPHTPTVFALRDDRYKYIFYHGVWDIQELYDLSLDPREMVNLIFAPEHRERVTAMRNRLFDLLEETDGMSIPLKRPTPWQASERLLSK
jgi:arylsulfatase A-like enzyme